MKEMKEMKEISELKRNKNKRASAAANVEAGPPPPRLESHPSLANNMSNSSTLGRNPSTRRSEITECPPSLYAARNVA